MMNVKSIQKVSNSPMVSMGPIRLRQPIPNVGIENVDPFLLLHHYGPYAISAFNNPFDLGPHPHRGFEPITLLFKGEQFHRDSLGNEMVVKAGDVQWTTAGRGIVHAEAPTKEFVERSGDLEGIQLWLNLPAAKKMMTPNYQHIKSEDMPIFTNTDASIEVKIVAGKQGDLNGAAETQTDINIYMIQAKGEGSILLSVPENHNGALYLLEGEVLVNGEEELRFNENQISLFGQGGSEITFEAKKESNLIFISGEPFNEPIAQYGPYVMNTETEILEAMRDYQMGKMGYLY
jgi:hypothetical protein